MGDGGMLCSAVDIVRAVAQVAGRVKLFAAGVIDRQILVDMTYVDAWRRMWSLRKMRLPDMSDTSAVAHG